MGPESSSVAFLRELARRQGVEPSDEDLEAALGFLDAILPALEELEALLPADEQP